jgi:cytoskeletal protein RodZ
MSDTPSPQSKAPIYKKPWLYILAALLVTGVVGGGVGVITHQNAEITKVQLQATADRDATAAKDAKAKRDATAARAKAAAVAAAAKAQQQTAALAKAQREAADAQARASANANKPPKVVVVQPKPPAPVAPAPSYTSVTDLPAGLFCRDLKARGYGWSDATTYWNYWGQPANMDADLNGIPCETVY